jgi:hypothetical protein
VRIIIFIVLAVIVLIPGFLWWLHDKEDKAFMESLLLHQPIEFNQIHNARMWKSDENTVIQEADLKDIINWFNDYPANKITEQSDFDHTASNSGVKAAIYIDLNSGYKIKIFFVNDDSIYVVRTDVKGGMLISYSFLEKSPQLEQYFVDFLDNSKSIDFRLVESEKTLPHDFDEAAIKRKYIPYYQYLIKRADDPTQYKELWNYFRLKQQIKNVNFEENHVFFIGVRESGTCPYEIGDIKIDTDHQEMSIYLTGQDGPCTADATPRTFVIEIPKEISKDIKNVTMIESGVKTTVPLDSN